MTSSAPLIQVTDLEVGYGLPVCPPLTFTVGPGDVVAVIGPNGCGKSTLLRTVVGLLKPLAGELRLLDSEADERSQEFRASVAAELGDEAFFPTMTVREHLLLTCYGHGVSAPEEVTDFQLDSFGLTDRADALPSALSSGQRRRLLLSSVFVRPRSLMLLDEPEQRLDTRIRSMLAEWLVDERSQGGAVLMATHDPRLVEQCATSVIAISEENVRITDPVKGAAIIRDEF